MWVTKNELHWSVCRSIGPSEDDDDSDVNDDGGGGDDEDEESHHGRESIGFPLSRECRDDRSNSGFSRGIPLMDCDGNRDGDEDDHDDDDCDSW